MPKIRKQRLHASKRQQDGGQGQPRCSKIICQVLDCPRGRECAKYAWLIGSNIDDATNHVEYQPNEYDGGKCIGDFGSAKHLNSKQQQEDHTGDGNDNICGKGGKWGELYAAYVRGYVVVPVDDCSTSSTYLG